MSQSKSGSGGKQNLLQDTRRECDGNRAIFRELIRGRRQELHLSQELLAEKADISLNTVSRIEGGQTAMSVQVFRQLVIEVDILLGEVVPASEDRQLNELFHHICRLRWKEQKIVMQPVKALIDGVEQGKIIKGCLSH